MQHIIWWISKVFIFYHDSHWISLWWGLSYSYKIKIKGGYVSPLQIILFTCIQFARQAITAIWNWQLATIFNWNGILQNKEHEVIRGSGVDVLTGVSHKEWQLYILTCEEIFQISCW